MTDQDWDAMGDEEYTAAYTSQLEELAKTTGKTPAQLEAELGLKLGPLEFVWVWWGCVIASAVLDGDEESRRQLAEATGDPDAWEAFAAVQPDEGDDQGIWWWSRFLAHLASAPETVTASVGHQVLARVVERGLRIVYGAIAGNAACLPPD